MQTADSNQVQKYLNISIADTNGVYHKLSKFGLIMDDTAIKDCNEEQILQILKYAINNGGLRLSIWDRSKQGDKGEVTFPTA